MSKAVLAAQDGPIQYPADGFNFATGHASKCELHHWVNLMYKKSGLQL